MDTTQKETFKIYNERGFGLAIKQYRKQAGFTQAELAEELNIKQTDLSRLESGKMTQQTKRIVQVLRRLGIRLVAEKAEW